ncbi:MAG TPA: SBBP repeat-containing protein [Candidatus Angelobacter sp.]
MRLLGANRHAGVSGVDTLPGKSNYFIGNDPDRWRTNVVNYAKVQYENIYDGVDLVYYGNRRQLEYDFVVEPGAMPSQIRLLLSLPKDASGKCVHLDKNGDLATSTETGQVLLRRPYVYQSLDDKGARATKEIGGRYVVLSTKKLRDACSVTLGFQLERYRHTRPVIIDPVLVYSTYLGGTSTDIGTAIAVDATGSTYVTGVTASPNFPFQGGVQATRSAKGDVFVTKLDPSGLSIVYSTFLGGSFFNQGNGIAVDGAGNAYITGVTFTQDFPVTAGSFQTNGPTGAQSAFVTKLNPTGSALVYSTYLDGRINSAGNGIAVDAAGSAYVTGNTDSPDFPLMNPVQSVFAGGSNIGGDVFVSKLTPDGAALIFSTYLGGSSEDIGLGIAVDRAGNAYVAGRTQSPDFPTSSGAFQRTFGGDLLDAFVAKFDPAGSLIYSTFLGGSAIDLAHAVAADSEGNAYVGGVTGSTNFPLTPGSLQTTFTGTGDAFISKLNPSGSALIYSTLLAGNNTSRVRAMAVDGSGNVYVTGMTDSGDFPTACPTQPLGGGGTFDAFVSVLNQSGSGLLFSTFVGGDSQDIGLGIALDAPSSPSIYITGETNSTNFPTENPLQSVFQGGDLDAFVTKITPTSVAATTTSLTSLLNPAIVGQKVTFTANVAPACGSVGAPAGSVTFSDGTNTLGTATLASGQAGFSTSALSAGPHSITAAYSGDSNFNPSTSSPLTEVVEFNVCVLYDQTRSVHSGATIPIKLALCDINGNNVSSPNIIVHATQITSTSGFSGPADDSGNANPDNDFRSTGFGYIFNLSTAGLVSGTYMLQFTAGSDPLTHSVNFGVK